MTAQDLYVELGDMTEEERASRIVVVSTGSADNTCSPLDVAALGSYTPHSKRSGESGIDELTYELKAEGYSDKDIKEQKAVVLWPTY